MQGHRRCVTVHNGPGKQLAGELQEASTPPWYVGARTPSWGRSAGSMACVQGHASAQFIVQGHDVLPHGMRAQEVPRLCPVQSVLFACSVGLAGAGVLDRLVNGPPRFISLRVSEVVWGLFLGVHCPVRFPACGRRDLGGTLAGRRLFALGRWALPPPAPRALDAGVSPALSFRGGAAGGTADRCSSRPGPVTCSCFKTGMRARRASAAQPAVAQRRWLGKSSQ